jgi:hypothetical protein
MPTLDSTTLLIDFGAEPPKVETLGYPKLGLFFTELGFAENVYGTPAATLACLCKHLGKGARAFHPVYDVACCVRLAEDESLSDAIRAEAAALALGIDTTPQATPEAAPAPKATGKPSGSAGARLVPPQPTKPPSGARAAFSRSKFNLRASSNPLAALLEG